MSLTTPDFLYANGWTIAQARAAMMIDPTVANLNTGSFGPLPQPVFERVTELRARLAAEPMDFLVRQAGPLLWQSRRTLARFLGADPFRLIFTQNVSSAINIVASGLTLARPGEVLLTDHEYGAMHWCWERAAQRQGLTLRTFPLPVTAEDPAEIVDAFVRAMSDSTRLLFFSHVLSPTGLVLPARAICAEARKRGILTLIDGAHAPALIPLALDDLQCDFYTANCHKWLLAPTGSGFLYLGKGNEERLQPLHVSWGYRFDRRQLEAVDEWGTTPRLRFYEFEGFRDPCAWIAVQAAVEFQERLGFEHIRVRNAGLVAHVRQRIGANSELAVITPVHPQLHGFMTAFRMPAGAVGLDWQRKLWDRHRIEAAFPERPGFWILRISTHFYNTLEEIDRLAAALQALHGAG